MGTQQQLGAGLIRIPQSQVQAWCVDGYVLQAGCEPA